MAHQTGRAPGAPAGRPQGGRPQQGGQPRGPQGPQGGQGPGSTPEPSHPEARDEVCVPDKRPKEGGGAQRLYPGLSLFRKGGKGGKKTWSLPFRLNTMALVFFIPAYLWLLPVIGCQVRSERSLAKPVASLPSVNMGSVETEHFQVRLDKLQFYEVKASPGKVVEVIASGRVPVHRKLSEDHEIIQLVSPDGSLEELRPDGSIVPFHSSTTPDDLPKGQATSANRYLAQNASLYSLCGQFANGTKHQETDFPVITKGANAAFQIGAWQRRIGADHKPEYFAYFDVRARTPPEYLHSGKGIWYWWRSPHFYLFPNILWMSRTERDNAVDGSGGMFTSVGDLTRDWGWTDGFWAHVPDDVKPYWDVTVVVHE